VVLLVAILVFILQNGERARVRFLMVDGTLQLGMALLFAALLGALLVLRDDTRQVQRSQRMVQPPDRGLGRTALLV
jgi:uncharacterized integral membrane protein